MRVVTMTTSVTDGTMSLSLIPLIRYGGRYQTMAWNWCSSHYDVSQTWLSWDMWTNIVFWMVVFAWWWMRWIQHADGKGRLSGSIYSLWLASVTDQWCYCIAFAHNANSPQSGIHYNTHDSTPMKLSNGPFAGRCLLYCAPTIHFSKQTWSLLPNSAGKIHIGEHFCPPNCNLNRMNITIELVPSGTWMLW